METDTPNRNRLQRGGDSLIKQFEKIPKKGPFSEKGTRVVERGGPTLARKIQGILGDGRNSRKSWVPGANTTITKNMKGGMVWDRAV